MYKCCAFLDNYLDSDTVAWIYGTMASPLATWTYGTVAGVMSVQYGVASSSKKLLVADVSDRSSYLFEVVVQRGGRARKRVVSSEKSLLGL